MLPRKPIAQNFQLSKVAHDDELLSTLDIILVLLGVLNLNIY